MDINCQIDTFCRYAQVSRETINKLKLYEKLLKEANKNLNLIGNSTLENIWHRHFLDSLQAIDFIEKKDKIITDIGSGAGFPGVVLALAAKDKKITSELRLIEKSKKKSKFLKVLIEKLELKTKILNEDVMQKDFELRGDVFIARAFRPLTNILELIHSKSKNWKKILVFQGKNGKSELLQASKNWDIKYKQRKSITSNDSSIIEIMSLKKIN
jgi:16S rRNA (guanine527-N7)-methyltransferase